MRNFEKGVCEWASPNGSKPEHMVYLGKCLQDPLTVEKGLANVE